MRARPAGAPIALPTPWRKASAKNGQTRSGPAERHGEEAPEHDDVRRRSSTARRLRRGTRSASCPPGARAGAAAGTPPAPRARGRAGSPEPSRPATRSRRTTSGARRLGDERHPEEGEVAVPKRGSSVSAHFRSLGRRKPGLRTSPPAWRAGGLEARDRTGRRGRCARPGPVQRHHSGIPLERNIPLSRADRTRCRSGYRERSRADNSGAAAGRLQHGRPREARAGSVERRGSHDRDHARSRDHGQRTRRARDRSARRARR